jgi:hypothetical protein
MKNLFVTIFFSLIVFSVFAQDKANSNSKNHELKLNIGYTLAELPEITYEYILNDESAVGTSLTFGFENDLKFALTPYYRFYFGNKRAAGFFAEAFGMLNVVEDITYYLGSNSVSENETGFALGIAIGGKWITNNNWLFELYAGLGRNIINNESVDGVPRAGLTLGKRF